MSFTRPSARAALALAAILAVLAGTAPAQKEKAEPPKETVEKGKVQAGSHQLKMEGGKLYFIKVEGQGFTPNVMLRPGAFSYGTSKTEDDTFQTYFVPRETRAYRLLILPNINDDLDAGPLDYKVTSRHIPYGAKPALEENGTLAADDPIYSNEDGVKSQGPHKAFKLKLKARQLYVIDLERAAGKDKERRRDWDPYLMLEGPGGKIVSSDDDSGNDGNARIIIQVRRAGEYRVIATSAGKEPGAFTLTVRTGEE